MDNRDYARILEEIAALLKIKGANRFRIRAFENAAHTIGATSQSLEDLMDRGELTELSNIGDGIADKLREIRQKGTCDHHQRLLDELDPGLLDLLDIQGLGPKRIQKLYRQLGITDLQALQTAGEEGRIQQLSGLGPKTEQKILDEIQRLAARDDRIPLPRARSIGQSLADQLSDVQGVETIELAGSLRRGRPTVGDIDLLVATDNPEPVHDRLRSLVEIQEVLVTGETKTSVRLRSGVQVDIRTVEPEIFGSALHYFTGSKQHHVLLRSRAKRRDIKISEYGLFEDGDPQPVTSRTERDLFEALDLQYIPPELREGGAEIEQAARGELPDLVDASDLRGDLHMHTTETDGRASIEQMARAGAGRGYDFVAITDHSRAVQVADGMTAERFAAQIDDIRRLDDQIDDIRLLSGIEVDILKDGTLDMDHDLLARCDWVVASVHSHFQMAADRMTDRLVAAVETGLVSALGHPTGRILGGRDGYDYDFETVVDAAADRSVALEINGSAGRLDLDAELAGRARDRGAPIVLGSDAHSRRGLDDLDYALTQARRAGFEPDAILNCLDPDSLLEQTRPSLN